jgi:hypothetical protein
VWIGADAGDVGQLLNTGLSGLPCNAFSRFHVDGLEGLVTILDIDTGGIRGRLLACQGLLNRSVNMDISRD